MQEVSRAYSVVSISQLHCGGFITIGTSRKMQDMARTEGMNFLREIVRF
jgi:hypothetical protein